jgi:hypothetical protein
MAIQISGITVINNDAELSSGLKSTYDVVSTTATSKTLVNREFCTVTATGQTITLPASPQAGWEVVVSIDGTFTDTVVARNGQNIMGLAEDIILDKEYAAMNFIFVDATKGWRLY